MTTLTPAEARKKWCPLTMASDQILHCDGAACMAWRWMPADPNTDEPRRGGYCGIAGKPEAE